MQVFCFRNMVENECGKKLNKFNKKSICGINEKPLSKMDTIYGVVHFHEMG